MHRFGRDLQAKTRLAQPAHSEQRQQPCLVEEGFGLLELYVAADERCGLKGRLLGMSLTGSHQSPDLMTR